MIWGALWEGGKLVKVFWRNWGYTVVAVLVAVGFGIALPWGSLLPRWAMGLVWLIAFGLVIWESRQAGRDKPMRAFWLCRPHEHRWRMLTCWVGATRFFRTEDRARTLYVATDVWVKAECVRCGRLRAWREVDYLHQNLVDTLADIERLQALGVK